MLITGLCFGSLDEIADWGKEEPSLCPKELHVACTK
jgi:hypothetical protein